MIIRRAEQKDIPGIDKLLSEVNDIHAEGRPDIIIKGKKKYTDSELKRILEDNGTPVFVAVEGCDVLGHAFCVFEEIPEGTNNLHPMKTLYIDDICVDSEKRRLHVGKALFDHVKEFGKQQGVYRITLNVWAFNEPAMKFYQSMGMEPFKVVMETIL